MMNVQTHSIYLVDASFFYRLHIIKHEAPSRRIMTVICISILMLPIFMAICTLLSIDDEFEVRESFIIIYDLNDYVVQGHIDSHPKLVYKFSQLYTAGSALPFTIIVFFVRRKVILNLDAQREIMSKRTINVHKTLVKVLTIHAYLPAIFTLTIICYVIEKGGIHHSVFEQFIRITLSLMTAIGPYISIFNIRVFRDFLSCRKDRVGLKGSLSFASAVPSKSMRNY